MIIEGLGHYVSLIAEGPGDALWYTASGTWVANESLKKVFSGVQLAIKTPILGLPTGYRARLICSEIDVDNQSSGQGWECCCRG